MSFGTYDTATLLGVLNKQIPDPFFFQQFFTTEYYSQAEKIVFDEITENRYILAPFVAPHVEGRVMAKGGYDTKSFKPAYVKPKHDVDVSQQFTRRAGEAPVVGTLTPEQRYNACITENFAIEAEMIERRINWMCCQALQNAAIVISGEDYPTVTLDFGRDASLSTVLAGDAVWGSGSDDPLNDLKVMRKTSRSLCGGRITDIIMGEDAYDKFYSNAKVQALLSTQFRIGGSAADAGALGIAASDFDAEFKAVLVGGQDSSRLNIWTYAGFYHDRNPDTGVLTPVPYMDPNAVIGVGNILNGIQAFGAIKDPNANLLALRQFPRIVDQKNLDPAKEFTLTQSAPLAVPLQPNNSFKLQVDAVAS